jgi:hypothetical protein
MAAHHLTVYRLREGDWTPMPIVVRKQDDKYIASVTPPHGGGRYWRNDAPLLADELIERLRALGCHTTDIADAFYEADPLWLNR